MTIELGEFGGPTEVRRDLPLPGNFWRALSTAALVVVCLAVLGGSSTVESGLGNPLWSTNISLAGFTFGTDSVYSAEYSGAFGTPDRHDVMLARDLHSGAVRWRLDVTQRPLFTLDLGGGVAAAVTEPAVASQTRPDWNVTFVDGRTGATLGHANGSALYRPTVGGTGRLVLSAPVDDRLDVFGVDGRTGHEVWRMTLPQGSTNSYVNGDERFDTILVTNLDATVRIYSAETGELVESGTVPGLSPSTQALLFADHLVTALRGGDETVVTAYRRGSFSKEWAVTVPHDSASGQVLSYVQDCGPVVCLYVGAYAGSAPDGGTVLIDLATGRLRGTVALQVEGAAGTHVLLAGALFDPTRPAASVAAGLSVLDATDGHTLSRYPDSISLDWPGGGGRAMLAQTGPARTAFIIVDPDGTRRPIGSVSGRELDCAAQSDTLACSDHAGLLRVWHIPPP